METRTLQKLLKAINYYKVILVVWSVWPIFGYAQSCTNNYSYQINNDTVWFTNQSVIDNPYYYWNFGDGSSSYETNPRHVFPESGEYIVTLYARDTGFRCITKRDTLIIVDKYSTFFCNPEFTEEITINDTFERFIFYDQSFNCENLICNFDMNFAGNMPSGEILEYDKINKEFGSQLMVIQKHYDYIFDSINGNNLDIYREYFKNYYLRYNTSSILDDSCSANFEFYSEHKPNGVFVQLKAMKNGYKSYIFGASKGSFNPLKIYADTGLMFFEYPPKQYKKIIQSISLKIEDSTGCKRQFQQAILINNPNYEFIGRPTITRNIIKQNSEINVYPNPVLGNYFSIDGLHVKKVVLFALNGQILQTWEEPNQTNFSLNKSYNGVYVLKIATAKGYLLKKIVISN